MCSASGPGPDVNDGGEKGAERYVQGVNKRRPREVVPESRD